MLETIRTERISFRVSEAAATLGISEAMIRKAIREGQLKPGRAGRAVLIFKEDLERWIRGEQQESQPEAA